MKQTRLVTFFPLVGYIALVVLVFGNALFPGDNKLLFGDDIHRAYYFFREFFNYWIARGVVPWWNPYNFSGTPFIADAIVNIWYPPNWLFVFLPLPIAYSWHIALHIIFAMTGMYKLISNFKLKISNSLGAWVGGVVFGLSGFFVARTYAGHVDVIAAASFMPWVVWAFWQVLDSRNQRNSDSGNRRVIVAAVLFALQLFAGYQTMAFLTVEAIGIVTLVYCFTVKSLKPVFRVMLPGLLGIGLAGLQIVPVQEFFRHGIRTFTFPYSWISYGSLTFESLIQLVHPFYFGDQVTYAGPPPNYHEHAMFVGRIGIFFCIISFFVLLVQTVRRWLRPRPGNKFFGDARQRSSLNEDSAPKGKADPVVLIGRIFSAPQNYFPGAMKNTFIAFCSIALFGLWVSLGPNAPIDLQKILWQVIPMYHYLRIPPRHLILFVFGMSALVGFSLESLITTKALKSLIAAAIVVEMVLFARHFIVLKEVPEVRHDPALISLLKQDKEPYRVLENFAVWAQPRDSFDFDSAMSYRIFSATGYDPSILRSYYEFIDAVNGAAEPSILQYDVQVPYLDVSSPYLDFLNVKYILVPREYDSLGGISTNRFTLIREDIARDYRLYENTTVNQRFFLSSGVLETGEKPGSIDEASLQSMFHCQDPHEGVDIVSYMPNSIALTSHSLCARILRSSEVMYPGWGAYVDGKKTDIWYGNHAFRTLFVPSGKHTVEFRYSPRIFMIGALISVIFGIGAIVIWRRT